MMKRCLYCNRPIRPSASLEEKESEWHTECAQEFFGFLEVPKLDLDSKTIEELAKRTIMQGLTVPGVQKKISLHLSRDGQPRLTLVDYPSGYILKPQNKEYPWLPEFEETAMRMAVAAGIRTVPFALIRMEDQYAYITRRIDRCKQGKLAMEDFCQLTGRLTRDKYRGSYEAIGRKIAEYSMQPGLDLTILFSLLVFSFITGNSDLHLKNVSLIEERPGSREYSLSKIYDILPVNIVLPSDQEETALTLNGKKKNLHRKDFLQFALRVGLQKKQAERLLDQMLAQEKKILAELNCSRLPKQEQAAWKDLIMERCSRLRKNN